MAHKLLQGKTVKMEEVYVDVTCPVCRNRYSVQLKPRVLRFGHNCRCQKVTIKFNASNVRGGIDVLAAAYGEFQELLEELHLTPDDISFK